MTKKVIKHNCKVSYHIRLNNDTGAVYKQTIMMDIETFEYLADEVKSEIENGYKQEDKYSFTAGYAKAYLNHLHLINDKICYLTPTEAKFIDLSLKLGLKTDRNTCIIIKNKKNL